MQLLANHFYKRRELRYFLSNCPFCGLEDQVSIWTSVVNSSVQKGKEGIKCDRCKLDISFIFSMGQDNEIIDEYLLDYFKLGNMEYKNNDTKLTLYLNNIYIKDIDNNAVDLDKCRKLMVLS